VGVWGNCEGVKNPKKIKQNCISSGRGGTDRKKKVGRELALASSVGMTPGDGMGIQKKEIPTNAPWERNLNRKDPPKKPTTPQT